MKIAGVEEAGRGPVIGPMVMAITMVEEKDLIKLEQMGVKDSKLLTPKIRNELFDEIKEVAEYEIVVIEPGVVDEHVNSKESNLNWMEAEYSAKLINKVKPDKVILDCPSTNINAYRERVEKQVEGKTQVVAEHKADLNHIIVGAASILAKVTRDREIAKLKDQYNIEFGSGYPSDPLTIRFLEENWDKYHFFRKSWSSWQTIERKKGQKSLGEY